ncbi:MAG TPA: hypothetical protein VME70_06790 [Mycobacteriales bacterium]|nr:hypothetical protein [Mycobacteriales bacterium]
MHRIARAVGARDTAGPIRTAAGVYGAFDLIPSESYVHDPNYRLVILRWRSGRWIVNGELTAVPHQVPTGHGRHFVFWDFPDNYLRASHVYGLPGRAPVFVGSQGGGGGWGFMAADRVGGRWHWAHFVGCLVPVGCPPMGSDRDETTDAFVADHGIYSTIPNCRHGCGDSTAYFFNRWRWAQADHAFVVARQQTLSRRQVSCLASTPLCRILRKGYE